MDPETMNAILAIADDLQTQVMRLKSLIDTTKSQDEPLDPKDPRNKNGVNLTRRGVYVIFRLFDQGKTRHAAKELMGISFNAANYRYEQWLKEGGKDRVINPFSERVHLNGAA
jgi:hypothetical protein